MYRKKVVEDQDNSNNSTAFRYLKEKDIDDIRISELDADDDDNNLF